MPKGWMPTNRHRLTSCTLRIGGGEGGGGCQRRQAGRSFEMQGPQYEAGAWLEARSSA